MNDLDKHIKRIRDFGKWLCRDRTSAYKFMREHSFYKNVLEVRVPKGFLKKSKEEKV